MTNFTTSFEALKSSFRPVDYPADRPIEPDSLLPVQTALAAPAAPAAPGFSVAAGTPSRSKWEGLGFVGTNMSKPLAYSPMMIVGEQNCGKSYLLQSNPDCFIINVDLSSNPNPNAQAEMWPGVDRVTGRNIDLDGKPIVLTWKSILDKKAQLIRLAEQNKPRPKTVALDSVTFAITLIIHHIVKRFNKSSMEELDGRLVWNLVAEEIFTFATELNNAGYGVAFIAHLTRKWQPLTDTKSIEEIDIGLTPGIRERLSKFCEVIIPVIGAYESETVMTSKVIKMPDGKSIPQTTPEIVHVRKHRIPFDNPAFEKIVKTRTIKPMPTVQLTGTNVWAQLEEAYEARRT